MSVINKCDCEQIQRGDWPYPCLLLNELTGNVWLVYTGKYGTVVQSDSDTIGRVSSDDCNKSWHSEPNNWRLYGGVVTLCNEE